MPVASRLVVFLTRDSSPVRDFEEESSKGRARYFSVFLTNYPAMRYDGGLEPLRTCSLFC